MLRCIEQLVKGEKSVVGNHRTREYTERGIEKTDFIYFNTAICTVDYTNRTFTTNNGGYDTQSTNRAISDYRNYFQNQGFAESFDYLKDMLDYLVSIPFNHCISVVYANVDEPHRLLLSKDNNTVGEKIAVFHFNTPDYGETESFPFKGPQSLRKELVKLFKFYLDESFNG